jgi:hypothetical protein
MVTRVNKELLHAFLYLYNSVASRASLQNAAEFVLLEKKP